MPSFILEDIQPESIDIPYYCTPGILNKSRSKGVEISKTWMGNGEFDYENDALPLPYHEYESWQKLKVSLKAPIINKSNLKLLVGYKYSSEAIKVSRFGASFRETFKELDAKKVKSNQLSVILNKPLNNKKYLAFRLAYSSSGNYSKLSFDNQYASYKAMAFYGIKPHDNFEWGVGVYFSKNFRRTAALPFLVYNRNFGRNWGIESALPGYVYGRYNLGKNSIIMLGAEYSSKSYRLHAPLVSGETLDYALKHAEILGMLRIEQKIVPWVWADAKLGYQYNLPTKFESKNAATTPFNVEPSNGLFFQFGIFISPPDKFMCKN